MNKHREKLNNKYGIRKLKTGTACVAVAGIFIAGPPALNMSAAEMEPEEITIEVSDTEMIESDTPDAAVEAVETEIPAEDTEVIEAPVVEEVVTEDIAVEVEPAEPVEQTPVVEDVEIEETVAPEVIEPEIEVESPVAPEVEIPAEEEIVPEEQPVEDVTPEPVEDIEAPVEEDEITQPELPSEEVEDLPAEPELPVEEDVETPVEPELPVEDTVEPETDTPESPEEDETLPVEPELPSEETDTPVENEPESPEESEDNTDESEDNTDEPEEETGEDVTEDEEEVEAPVEDIVEQPEIPGFETDIVDETVITEDTIDDYKADVNYQAQLDAQEWFANELSYFRTYEGLNALQTKDHVTEFAFMKVVDMVKNNYFNASKHEFEDIAYQENFFFTDSETRPFLQDYPRHSIVVNRVNTNTDQWKDRPQNGFNMSVMLTQAADKNSQKVMMMDQWTHAGIGMYYNPVDRYTYFAQVFYADGELYPHELTEEDENYTVVTPDTAKEIIGESAMTETQKWQLDQVSKINSEREAQGASELTISQHLSEFAYMKALDMAANKYGNADKDGVGDATAQYNYLNGENALELPNNLTFNVYHGFLPANYKDDLAPATGFSTFRLAPINTEADYIQWIEQYGLENIMDSEEYRANLLNTEFTHMGLGLYTEGPGAEYQLVQVLYNDSDGTLQTFDETGERVPEEDVIPVEPEPEIPAEPEVPDEDIDNEEPVDPEIPEEDVETPVEPEPENPSEPEIPEEDVEEPVEPETPGEDSDTPVEPEQPIEPELPDEEVEEPAQPETPGEDTDESDSDTPETELPVEDEESVIENPSAPEEDDTPVTDTEGGGGHGGNLNPELPEEESPENPVEEQPIQGGGGGGGTPPAEEDTTAPVQPEVPAEDSEDIADEIITDNPPADSDENDYVVIPELPVDDPVETAPVESDVVEESETVTEDAVNSPETGVQAPNDPVADETSQTDAITPETDVQPSESNDIRVVQIDRAITLPEFEAAHDVIDVAQYSLVNAEPMAAAEVDESESDSVVTETVSENTAQAAEKNDSQDVLPNTGTSMSTAPIIGGVAALFAGLSLLTATRRKKQSEKQH